MSLRDQVAQLYHGYPDASFSFKDGYELAKNDATNVAREGDAAITEARQIITDLVEYAEQNDPGCPHIGRATTIVTGKP